MFYQDTLGSQLKQVMHSYTYFAGMKTKPFQEQLNTIGPGMYSI